MAIFIVTIYQLYCPNAGEPSTVRTTVPSYDVHVHTLFCETGGCMVIVFRWDMN